MKHLLSNWVVLASTAFLLTGCLETGSTASESEYTQKARSERASKQNTDDSVWNDIPVGIDPQTGEALTPGELSPPTAHIPKPNSPSSSRIKFDPENQVIPFPNNLIFEAGATKQEDLNGTLNAPISAPESSEAQISLALNDLNGFSTSESWRLEFTGAIDASTLQIGQTIRVFEMHEPQVNSYPHRIRPTHVARELSSDDIAIDYIETNDEAEPTFLVKLRPTMPLKRNRTYSIIFTYGIKGKDQKLIDVPLTGITAKDTSTLEFDENNQPITCNDINKSSLALLQCMTHFAISPVENDPRFALKREHIMLAWSVTTQTNDEVFARLADHIQNKRINPSIPSGTTCKSAICFLDVGSLLGKDAPETPGKKATVFPGTIRLPIYTSIPDEALSLGKNDYTFGKKATTEGLLIGQHWSCPSGSCNSDAAKKANELPTIKGWVTHPIVLAVPKSKAPSGGHPLVIFQHAIQQDRTNALAMADTLAEHGFAVIAIDMPLHGIVKHNLPSGDARAALYAGDLNDQLYNSTLSAARNIIPLKVERTFYLNLINGDGGIDDSGAHFLNPALPLVQRDILRQGALDLVTLARFLRNGEFEQCGMHTGLLKGCNRSSFAIQLKNHVNFKELHFVGHSVGNIIAAPFLAADKNIKTISMLAPSGATLRTLEGSDVIGPKLKDGLAAKNILPGTENYYRFFASVQSAIDSVEPLNHAQEMIKRTGSNGALEPRPVYMAIITGDETNPSDTVLPPSVSKQPLAGSLALARAMGLMQSNEIEDKQTFTANNENSLQVVSMFKWGEHASFLQKREDIKDSQFVGIDPHIEMQRQVANFLRNRGTQITNVDSSLLQ